MTPKEINNIAREFIEKNIPRKKVPRRMSILPVALPDPKQVIPFDPRYKSLTRQEPWISSWVIGYQYDTASKGDNPRVTAKAGKPERSEYVANVRVNPDRTATLESHEKLVYIYEGDPKVTWGGTWGKPQRQPISELGPLLDPLIQKKGPEPEI
jgi:hypothetical protein